MRTRTKYALEYCKDESIHYSRTYHAFSAGWDARDAHIRILIDALKDTVEHSTDIIAKRKAYEALVKFEEANEQP